MRRWEGTFFGLLVGGYLSLMIGGNELLAALPSLVWPETQGTVIRQGSAAIIAGARQEI